MGFCWSQTLSPKYIWNLTWPYINKVSSGPAKTCLPLGSVVNPCGYTSINIQKYFISDRNYGSTLVQGKHALNARAVSNWRLKVSHPTGIRSGFGNPNLQ